MISKNKRKTLYPRNTKGRFSCNIKTCNLLLFFNQLSFYSTSRVSLILIMKFVLRPSLEHMALVKIASSLWNQKNVRVLISKLSYDDLFSNEKWETIEKKVIQKTPHLSLPKLLKEKVFAVIKPIGVELLGWMQYHIRYNKRMGLHHTCLLAHPPADLCWTPQGTVDRKRTAEILVRDENLDISIRYMLACDNCLEDHIVEFWNKLPEDLKNCDWNNFPVISFWSYNMKRGGGGHISYKNIFLWSAARHNKVAAKYFLQKLTPQEREESLIRAAQSVWETDVLCFLLSELSEEKQRAVFLRFLFMNRLKLFLQWPWQSFFIGVVNYRWDLISKADFYKILRNIVCKVNDGYKYSNYQKLIREFWQESPTALKRSITNEIDKSCLLPIFFCFKDKESIRLILKDVNLTAKEKIIYSNKMKSFCERSICSNRWDFLEFCIREFLPSKKEMLKFKEEFENRRMSLSFKQNFTTKKHIWDKLFHFPDDSICESDKRSVEDDESSSSKRFRSLQ